MANLLKECDSVLASWVLPYAGANWGVNASQLTGITEAENATEGTVEGVTPTLPTVEKLDSYLFTLGEVAQRCDKSKVPRRLVTIVQTIVAPTFKAMKMMVNQSGAFIEKEISIPASTRAHAFVALGKLCLQDPQLAKSCISVFARELETSGSSVVRNNVMVIMCDLTIRYTNLVENYISKLAVCLRDESEMVRRQTLMLLTNLMQEDYIKLKNGSLFFRLIVVLVDDSPSLRQFALSCLESILSKGSSEAHAFYNHFVETIFYLNDYRLHSKYNKFPQTERERALFSFKGAENSQFRICKLFCFWLFLFLAFFPQLT
jgi:condensin-2 complex subunit D3